MTTVKYVKESPANTGARKASLEAESLSPGSMEAGSLRRVRSDSLTPSVHTFTPEFLSDEKNQSPKIKMKFDLYDSTELLGGDLAKGRTKKHSSKKRQRRSSVQKGVMLDVVGLHKLNKRQEKEDRESICGSDLSIRTNPSPELWRRREASNPSRLSPSLTITSPDNDSQRNFEDESDTSSIYHSSCLFQPEGSPNSAKNLLVNPKKAWEHHNRRMSSPSVSNMNRQQKVDAAGTRGTEMAEFPEGERRHSSQDMPHLGSHEPTMLSPRVKCYSTQEDLSAMPGQEKSSQSLPSNEDTSVTPTKEFRGSSESQIQLRKWKESGTDHPDHNCQSNFGIILSGICFVLFLWYLCLAGSSFIKSALSFEAFNEMHPPELVVQEVVVHIAVEEALEADTGVSL